MSPPPRTQLAVATVVVLAIALLGMFWVPSGLTRHSSGSPPQFVYRDGNRLYLDGDPYRFAGVNIYWANNRQPVGCGPAVSASQLGTSLDAIRGSANAVRAWFFQSQATVDGVRDWTAFDQTLDALASRGMKVVVTLANQHGVCGDPPGGEKDIEWYRNGYASEVPTGFPQTYRDYVRDVVARYADRPEILAWQLMNEASAFTAGIGCPDEAAAAGVLRAWTDDMGGLIRSIDPHHLISVGTGLQGACGTQVTGDPLHSSYRYVHQSPHIDLCEYHDYNVPTTPLFILQRWEMDTCGTLGKAFFVGELGILRGNPDRAALIEPKLEAQFGYAPEPAQGVLIWSFGSRRVALCRRYCVEIGDPVLDVLARFVE